MTKTPPKPSLSNLPPELILQISYRLHLPARLSFKLLNRQIYFTLPALKPTQAELSRISVCAKAALYAHMQFNTSRRRCALCKQFYPNHLFPRLLDRSEEDAERKRVLERGYSYLGGPGMVDMPNDVCLWHQPQFVTWRRADTALHEVHDPRWSEAGWYSRIERLCMHCQGFSPINRSTPWTPPTCCCDTCAVKEVRTYIRYETSVDPRCANVVVWKDEEGVMWVREWNDNVLHNGPGKGVEWYFPLLDRRSLLAPLGVGDTQGFRDVKVTVLE